jgi:hypothetical protein
MREAIADERLLAAVDQARTALLEITPADTIGEPLGHIVEGEQLLSLLFDCNLSGYPGWRWTVTLARVDEDDPTVLEAELTPGDEALIAPEWVPWSDRLADYRTAQELASAVAAAEALDVDDDESDDDEADDDESDDDDDDDDDDESDKDPLALDDEDFDDDRGEDVLDGIDFGEGLTAPESHPGQAGQAQAETDDGSPEPPVDARGGELAAEDDRENERH